MIFSRVSLAMDAPSRKARDTVMEDTPARRATSDIVGVEDFDDFAFMARPANSIPSSGPPVCYR